MNVFQQFDKEFLKNVVGVYIEDLKTFMKDDPDIIESKGMTTSQGNFDNDYVNWRIFIDDLGAGPKGLILVHKKPEETWPE